MAKKQTPKNAVTPPKGRPTRSRDGNYGNRRVFGATAQWIAIIAGVILVFLIAFILLDGGDFNPFNEDDVNFNTSHPAGAVVAEIDSLSQPTKSNTF